MTRNWRVAAALLATLALGFGACGKKNKLERAQAFPDSLVKREVVAVVNGDTITAKDLRVLAYTTTPALADSLKSRSFNLMLLDQMIDRRLFIQEAKAAGTTVPDSMVGQMMDHFLMQFGGEDHANTALAKMGFAPTDVREAVRRDMTIRSYVQNTIQPAIAVSDEDARAYFDQHESDFGAKDSVRVRHIIVMFHPDDTDQKKLERKAFLTGIRKRALKGEDFGRLAQQYSEDGSAQHGGDLGYFTHGMMVPQFEEAAFALKKGEISDVVETRFGYHLIKCVDKKPAAPTSFDDVKPRIEAMLKQQALGTDLQNRLKKDRDAAIIVRNYNTGA
jgi:peptidyl-prolyl cis-trans isomerase C